jgi:hypothetical protein
MPQTSKTPPVEGGASRVQLGGCSHPFPTVDTYRTQFLILAHAVRPEMAGMLAALAFGGCGHG